MKVRGLVWVGTMTPDFARTVAFFRDRLGLQPEYETDGFTMFRLPDTSQLEVFAPGKEHDHFTTGPVAEFLVDDVAAAAEELRAARVPVWGPWHETEETRYGWLHFRAPDGRIYGLTNGPEYRVVEPDLPKTRAPRR